MVREVFQKGFASILIVVLVVLVLTGGGVFFVLKNKDSVKAPELQNLVNDTHTVSQEGNTDINSHLGIPCKSNPGVMFTHDVTEVEKIASVEPTIITPGNSRHRAWLNISGKQKVAVYAPVDSELVNGVYKDARGAIDYDLHFQVSCEVWYLINHITEPVEKVKKLFPDTPQKDTRLNSPFREPVKFKAGELLGYTTGTPVAHNFDFGVFDLNHENEGLPADEGSKYGKEKNFICPFDVLPINIRQQYYAKIIVSEKQHSNCLLH